MEKIVGSSPRGVRNFSHGNLSKINPLVLKSHYNKLINKLHGNIINMLVDVPNIFKIKNETCLFQYNLSVTSIGLF